MNRLTRSTLTLGAALAVAAVAPPARADDRCPDHGHRPAPVAIAPAGVGVVVRAPSIAVTLPLAVAAPPAVPAAPPPAFERAGWRAQRAGWELRDEYRRLEEARGRFYATWNGNPWRRDRFEGWYAARRAELDRRWSELDRWRGHRDHERWERRDG